MIRKLIPLAGLVMALASSVPAGAQTLQEAVGAGNGIHISALADDAALGVHLIGTRGTAAHGGLGGIAVGGTGSEQVVCARVERYADGMIDIGCGNVRIDVADDLSTATVSGTFPSSLYADGDVTDSGYVGPSHIVVSASLTATSIALPGGHYGFNGWPAAHAYGHTAAQFRWADGNVEVTSASVGTLRTTQTGQRIFTGSFHWSLAGN